MEGRDADTEAVHAADQVVADDALRRWGEHPGDRARVGRGPCASLPTAAPSEPSPAPPSTVREYLSRAAAAGIGWPLAADVTDESLMARLFVNAGVRAGARFHAEPDWSALVGELKRPGVNLLVLWEEYRAVHPEGYAYSRFCQLFREFERRLSPPLPFHRPCRWNLRQLRQPCASSTRRDTRRSSTTPASRCRLPTQSQVS